MYNDLSVSYVKRAAKFGLGGSGSVSAKEHLPGRRRAATKLPLGTRTALYLRVSTADQKPDLQYDGLRAYAARAGLDVIQDYCDVAVSGRREGRPRLNALMTAARNHEIDCVLVWNSIASRAARAICWRHLKNSTISACASSASRIRWTPTVPWAGRCSLSLLPWPSWNYR